MGDGVKPAGAGRIRSAQTNGGNITVSERDKMGQKEIYLGQTDIEARVYKPSVFYVLARGDLSYQGLEFKHNFVDRIMKDALKRPF